MERNTKVYMACSHVHHMSYYMSQLQYQFISRDMLLQKFSGVAILVSLQECGFFQNITLHRPKLRPISSNAINRCLLLWR